MNTEDLFKLLKGANITINVQTGSGTMYTANQMQVNHNHAAPERRAAVWTCNKCGFSSSDPTLFNKYFAGGARCWNCERKEVAARKAKEANVWRIVASRPNPAPVECERDPEPLALPEPKEPAFDLQAYFRELDERYESAHREMIENVIKHVESEYKRLNRK